MASEVGSTLLLFIAAVGVAALAGGVMAGVVNDMANELRNRGGVMADALATDVAIVNDPDHVPISDKNLTLYVKNTGSATLAPEDLLVLVNGGAVATSEQLLDGATKWHPQGVLEVTATTDTALASGDHSVQISYQTVTDRMSFRV